MKFFKKFVAISCAILPFTFFGLFSCKKSNAESLVHKALTKKDSINIVDPKTNNNSFKPSINLGKDSSIVSYHNFDSSEGEWFEKSMFFPYSYALSDSTKKKGRSLRIELRKGDGIRAEFGTDPKLSTKEGWFGFSVFFPLNFVKDRSSSESIVQFQARPDFDLGEYWRSAPLFLGVLNDRMILEVRTDSNKVTPQDKYNFERIDLGPLVKDEWLDCVFHIKWAHDNTGVIELWKNNILVYSRINKPNCYNDKLYPYFKIGIYKWDWASLSSSTTTQRNIFIDEVRIGNSNANYDKVYSGYK